MISTKYVGPARPGEDEGEARRSDLLGGEIEHPDYLPWKIDADQRLGLCSSYERTCVLSMESAAETNPKTRVALFLDWYGTCDAPWDWRFNIAASLRDALRNVPLADMLPQAERAFRDSLPAEIELFRGCDLGRELGLSWTTDIEVARGFASGKRCTNGCPSLISAQISKPHVFGIFLDREESEVAVDPRRLRRLRITETMDIIAADMLDAEGQVIC
jgi:hypothetical protein